MAPSGGEMEETHLNLCWLYFSLIAGSVPVRLLAT